MIYFTIVILLLVLIILSSVSKQENLSLLNPEAGVPDYLLQYIGYWIYRSEDNLRNEIISINYAGGDNFLKITFQTTIQKWFPPVFEGNLPEVSPPERFLEQPPLFRVSKLYQDEILITSIEPTYFFSPSHIKISTNHDYIMYRGKKYISNTLIDTSALTFIGSGM